LGALVGAIAAFAIHLNTAYAGQSPAQVLQVRVVRWQGLFRTLSFPGSLLL